MDDEKIVELFLQRDEAAIGYTAEKYGSRLRSLSFGIVGDRQTAEECENDTYIEAWNRIPPHEPRDHLYAFLARMTRNISLNRCRDRSRLKRSAFICQLSAEMEACICGPCGGQRQIDDILFADLMNRFLLQLPPQQRNIFLRRYWFMDSVSDISKRFGISDSKTKTTLFRCRQRLKEYLQKEGYTL